MRTVFDGAGNLTTYDDKYTGAGDTDNVTYTYNAADQLTTVTDPAGTITYTYGATKSSSDNTFGRVKTVSYPGTTPVTLGYTYLESGKIETITPVGIGGLSGYSYTYRSGSTDQNVMRTKPTTGPPLDGMEVPGCSGRGLARKLSWVAGRGDPGR